MYDAQVEWKCLFSGNLDFLNDFINYMGLNNEYEFFKDSQCFLSCDIMAKHAVPTFRTISVSPIHIFSEPLPIEKYVLKYKIIVMQ